MNQPASTASHTDATTSGSPAPRACERWNILRAACVRIDEERALERFSELKGSLPSRVARRMSRLGLMLTHLLEQTGIAEDTAVIYASTFGEGRTLETYLDSFPEASPLGFQSSIHPSGVEQGLIYRQQAVREFFPMAGGKNLPLCQLLQLRLCSAHGGKVLLLGGEEAGIWLKDFGLAADSNFAFALLVEPALRGSASAGSVAGHIELLQAPLPAAGSDGTQGGSASAQQPAGEADESPGLDALTAAIDERRDLHLYHPQWGSWLISWKREDGEDSSPD